MAMTLKEFVTLMHSDVDAFESYWKEMNEKQPERFPISFETGNEGLWADMFEAFVDSTLTEQMQ